MFFTRELKSRNFSLEGVAIFGYFRSKISDTRKILDGCANYWNEELIPVKSIFSRNRPFPESTVFCALLKRILSLHERDLEMYVG